MIWPLGEQRVVLFSGWSSFHSIASTALLWSCCVMATWAFFMHPIVHWSNQEGRKEAWICQIVFTYKEMVHARSESPAQGEWNVRVDHRNEGQNSEKRTVRDKATILSSGPLGPLRLAHLASGLLEARMPSASYEVDNSQSPETGHLCQPHRHGRTRPRPWSQTSISEMTANSSSL